MWSWNFKILHQLAPSGALIPDYNHFFQLSYLNLGADTEEECDEIEVIVDDGHQRVSALLKGASLDLEIV